LPTGTLDSDADALHALIRRRPLGRLDESLPLASLLRNLEYIRLSSPRWASDPEVQAALAKLTNADRAQLGRRVRRRGTYVRSTRPWSHILGRIAIDQCVWEARKLAKRKREKVAEQFKMDQRGVDEIMRHYNREGRRLLGLGARFRGSAARELEAEARKRGFRVRNHRLVLGTRHCTSWDEVRHWFAHALWNAKCLAGGHPPLPWRPDCRDSCVKARDRLVPAYLLHPTATPPRPSRQLGKCP